MEKLYIMMNEIIIGKNPKIDDNVIIGYLSKSGGKKTRIGDNCIIRSGTVIYAGTIIGENFQTGHNALIRENCHIGKNVSVGSGSIVEYGVDIGDNVRIHSNSTIVAYSKLEPHCFIGPNVVFANVLHPKCSKAEECAKIEAPRIMSFAKIGAGSTILPGVVIGDHVLVGSGSVVIKSVPRMSVVVGNPAKIIKQIDELICKHKWVEHLYDLNKDDELLNNLY